ncbi:MAG: AraC family transcriptional regulator [Bacilli bacterium]|nr:AraC family transcriptional regulator [Bacilli bacterium]
MNKMFSFVYNSVMRFFSSKTYSEKEPYVHVIFQHAKVEQKHTHDFIEIVYVNSGKMVQNVNGKEFSVKKGDLLFINFNSIHSFRPIGEATFYNICFYPETLEKIITPQNAFSLLSLSAFNEISGDANEGVISFDSKEQKEISGILEIMLREQSQRLPRFDVINQGYLNIIIMKMLRKTSIPADPEQDVWNELAEYIESNLDADLSLEALAKKCFYNPSYFSRLFKSKFNVPLIEYVSRKRIDKAVELLSDTELSVEAVAASSGFSNKSAFYRAFSKYTGKTPADFRDKSKKI